MTSAERELFIVPAGAGAGKTHKIRETLAEWVEKEIVRPERILAVTYTEAAAAELRERIRSGLLAKGMVTAALAAERAYISTIHGLGLRILTEHALAAGASPKPRHLSDAEKDLLIRQALAHASSLDPIKADPARYGYVYNWNTGESPEEMLRKKVLGIIDLLRGLGEKGKDPNLIAPALARLDTIHGEIRPDPEAARGSLVRAVSEMLAAFPNGGMATVTAKDPRSELESDLQLFRRVSKDPDLLKSDWRLWQGLRKLFTSNTRSKTPPGYDGLAERIKAAADLLVGHPGPLQDAKEHLNCLITSAQEVMSNYDKRKQALGLIDFADMISGAEALLRNNPAVLQAVLDEIDCVIIDEFQDTSPVQFAFLWQLGSQAKRTLLVGDVKQSIMAFQGADPRLSTALADANPGSIKPLDKNWRSTPAVMQFVNALGDGLFKKEYNRLEPTRHPVDGLALEILKVKKGRLVRDYSRPHEHVAERITRILQDGEQVTDRQTKQPRIVRPSDIALLVCQHETAKDYAAELRRRNVPVRILEDGWAKADVVQVACAALSCVANPRDIHSALIVRTMGPKPLSLEDALQRQIDGSLLEDPLLQALAGLSEPIARLPVPEALSQVAEVAGLEDWAAGKSDSAQAMADLLRLEAEAEAFEAAHRDLRAASGFHGQSVKVFLGWLDARRGEKNFDNRPDPSGNSAEAVEIVTWHASKGREWPITVVAELDNDIEERPRTTSARFGSLDKIDDMTAVLETAELVHTPLFAAREIQDRFVEDRRKTFEANARNLLYVALTRARDRIVIEWPDFLKPRKGKPASCLFHVLEDTCRLVLTTNALVINGVECVARIAATEDRSSLTIYGAERESRVACFGLKEPLPAVPLTSWRVQPSAIKEGHGTAPPSRNITLGDPWLVSGSTAEQGTALHLAMRTFLNKPELAGNLSAATGLDYKMLEKVEQRAKVLKAWLAEQGYTELRCEFPISGQMPEGGEVLGTIDLVAIRTDGSIIIDHKSGGGEGLGSYWPQISAYIRILRTMSPFKNIDCGIFWMNSGVLTLGQIGDGTNENHREV
jgi:ATP-dependent helicase/nuclease subunit A